jgi:hypothetical protein
MRWAEPLAEVLGIMALPIPRRHHASALSDRGLPGFHVTGRQRQVMITRIKGHDVGTTNGGCPMRRRRGIRHPNERASAGREDSVVGSSTRDHVNGSGTAESAGTAPRTDSERLSAGIVDMTEKSGFSLRGTLEGIALVLAPGTLLAAIAYYFGWVRTDALYAYFGIDVAHLGLSTTDYILRSVEPLWLPVSVILLIILLGVWGHNVLDRWLGVGRYSLQLRILTWVLLVLGISFLFRGVLGIIMPPRQAFQLAPLSIAAGAGLFGYAIFLRRRLMTSTSSSGHVRRESPSRLAIVSIALLVNLIVLNLFWATAIFADAFGRGRAQYLERTGFTSIPDVIIYSENRLHLDARDVQEKDLGATYAPYRFRYEGFKLLIRANSRLFLIPYSWSTDNAFTLVLPDDGSVRVEFAPNF